MKYEIVDSATVKVYDCRDRVFLISPEDIELIKKYTWYVAKSGYVERKDWAKGANITKRIHKAVMPDAPMVDHINGIKTDNRRCNLRFCTKSTNAMNTGLPSDNKLGCKGIVRRTEWNYRGREVYRVSVVVNKRRIDLGTYHSLQEAIDARVVGEKKYFGEYRRIVNG